VGYDDCTLGIGAMLVVSGRRPEGSVSGELRLRIRL
jgi:hypothetical protein